MKGLRRLHRVMGLSLVTAALVLLWALPGTAGAAVQLGQVSPVNPLECVPNLNTVQRVTVAGQNYQVPAPGGVITSWSHRGNDPAPAGSGRLQIWDSTGGNDFTLIGRSELETFSVGLTRTFLTRIPVDPGDQVGLRTVEDGTGCAYSAAGNTVNFESDATDPDPGDVRTLIPDPPPYLLNVAAVLESDADADGFGDETQDACLGEAGPNSGCATPPANPPQPQPPPPVEPPAGGGPPPEALTLDLGAKKQKVKKNVKFSATASVASTLVAEGKKIKDTTTELAADQKTTVKAKLKRKARNRFEEKGKGKVKVTGTASTLSGATTDTVKVKLKD